MSDALEVKIVVAPSLLNHVKEGLAQQHSRADPQNRIIDLLTLILNGSEFPIDAERTKSGAIHVAYHLRSFSQPIF